MEDNIIKVVIHREGGDHIIEFENMDAAMVYQEHLVFNRGIDAEIL